MKTIRLPFSAFICALLFCTGIAQGQSVTINSIPRTSFCDGDSISVSFTATGLWGHRNAFTLQLSDPTGSFSSFQNLASLVDTLPGTFTINTTIPFVVVSSTHYRFRILAAIPYMTSADNGNDIGIWTLPAVGSGSTTWGPGSIGTPITLITGFGKADIADLSDIANWDFGSGATPAKATTSATRDYFDGVEFSQAVTYSTPGDKTVTFTIVSPGGCSGTGTYKLHIYDCSNPSIPHDAIIINPDTTVVVESSKTYWVNPGATLTLNGPQHDTIFAEPGSTISGAYGCILYMKGGSVLILSPYSGSNTVIFGNGASTNLGSSDLNLNCPTLDFDYSAAPPNAAHPVDGVVNAPLQSVTISPNPTRGIISIQGAPSNDMNISVLNILGETMMQPMNPHTSDFTLDLSKLASGTYYIRFSSANSVVTKMVVRE